MSSRPPRRCESPGRGTVARKALRLLWALLLVSGGPAIAVAADQPTCDGGPRPAAAGGDLRSPPRPDGPTEVRAGLFVEDLRDIDAVSASFRLRGIVTVTWCDPRLAFDPAAAGTTEKVFFGAEAASEAAKVFTARGFVVNQVEEPRVTERIARIRSDGTVSTDLNISVQLSAQFDLRRFPFDHQRLRLEIESFLWDERHVVFVADESLTGFADDFEIAEWEITDVRADVSTVDVIRSSEPFSRLTLTIDIRRKVGFYLWKVLLPLVIIVALSWSVFWMSDERFGVRVRTSATGILTVVAYQFVAGQDLPRVGYLTLIDKVMVVSFLLLAITVLESYVVSRFPAEDRAGAARVDRTSRWLFPLAYVVLFALVFRLTPS